VPFASVNGQQLYFEDTAGNGPVVVFSHGNLMNRITHPALMVHGEADQPIPLPLGQMLRDGLPGALDLIVIPGAGHTPSLTHPDQVNGSLAAFLRQRA
jgi:pimeloyl-ACP methyl ester carboxylesterase